MNTGYAWAAIDKRTSEANRRDRWRPDGISLVLASSQVVLLDRGSVPDLCALVVQVLQPIS